MLDGARFSIKVQVLGPIGLGGGRPTTILTLTCLGVEKFSPKPDPRKLGVNWIQQKTRPNGSDGVFAQGQVVGLGIRFMKLQFFIFFHLALPPCEFLLLLMTMNIKDELNCCNLVIWKIMKPQFHKRWRRRYVLLKKT